MVQELPTAYGNLVQSISTIFFFNGVQLEILLFS
jgi:hypothetical protein